MHLVYHIVAVHEPSRRVMASRTPCGWLLPTLVAEDDVAQSRLLKLATAALPFSATPRCLARPHIDRAAGSADLTLIADILETPEADDKRLAPLAELLGSVPVVGYQASALRLIDTAAGDAGVRHGFLRRHWIEEVAAWVAQTTGHQPQDLVEAAEIHRAEEHRAVVTFRAPGEVLHFKGDVRTPFIEAQVTQFIATRVNDLVAPTRAYDEDRGWWLTRHVDGLPLDASRWPAHLAAVEAWTRLQLALQPSHAALVALGGPCLKATKLRSAVVKALGIVSENPPGDFSAARVLDRAEWLLAMPIARDVPSLALHFDAAPRNVLWNGQRPVFLDFESVCIGPAVIAGELMRRRMRADLSPAQGRQLTTHAARALLDAVGRRELESELTWVPALTDLCLLAARRLQLQGSEEVVTDEASRRYTWGHVARDFVDRASRWPLPPGASGA